MHKTRAVGAALLLAALAAATVPGSPAAVAADCDAEVAEAFAKQRKSSAFRLKTQMINERGLVNMTVDYQLPDRMHQRVKAVIDPAAIETILVGERAWVSSSAGWQALPAEDAEEIARQVRETVVEPPKTPPKYSCLGTVAVEGRQLTGYQVIEEKSAPKDGPLRIVYIDPTTGLPVRTIVAQSANLERPFFKQDFSYPQDIRIEPPKDVKSAK